MTAWTSFPRITFLSEITMSNGYVLSFLETTISYAASLAVQRSTNSLSLDESVVYHNKTDFENCYGNHL